MNDCTYLRGKVNLDKKTGKAKVVHCAYEEALHRQTESPNRTGNPLGNSGTAVGVDPDPEMIAVARRKAKGENLEIDFRVGVIESLPFPDDTFDVVTSSLMMHHLPEHLRIKGLAETFRVLKPGGRILIAEMRRPTGSAFQRFFTSRLLHHGHVVEFGLENIPKLMSEAGFEGIKQMDDHFLTVGFVCAIK